MSPTVITGKSMPVGPARFRIDAVGPGGAAAAAQDVRADDEVAVRVDGVAGPHHDVPPAGVVLRVVPRHVRVAGKGVADEHRVVPPRIQLPVDFVHHGHLGEQAAQFQR